MEHPTLKLTILMYFNYIKNEKHYYNRITTYLSSSKL